MQRTYIAEILLLPYTLGQQIYFYVFKCYFSLKLVSHTFFIAPPNNFHTIYRIYREGVLVLSLIAGMAAAAQKWGGGGLEMQRGQMYPLHISSGRGGRGFRPHPQPPLTGDCYTDTVPAVSTRTCSNGFLA